MLALIAGLFVPAAGVWLTTHRMAWGVIVAMFLINGYQTDLRTFGFGKRLAVAFVLAALISFAGGGFLGWGLAKLLHFEADIASGILVMSVMAPTLSSVVVITHESNGNRVWAILLTVGLNLLSMFTIPAMLALMLSGTAVALPVMPLLLDLLASVLAPFLIGLILRRKLKKPAPAWINGLPVFLIITLSYMAFASGRTTLMNSTAGTIALLVASLLALHFILMLAAIAAGALLGYKTPERKAIAFISSQKTLPTAIGILVSLGLAGGAAALPCVIYHFGQVLCDSVIAALWRSWTDRANASGVRRQNEAGMAVKRWASDRIFRIPDFSARHAKHHEP